MMSSTRRALATILVGMSPNVFSGPALADVFVIAHPSVQIGASEIRDVFLGDKQFSGDVKLIPIDNGPAQEQFLARALKIDGARYNSSWTKKSFRHGLNPPTIKSGDSEVLDFVRRTPGAIGYVANLPAGTPFVQRF